MPLMETLRSKEVLACGIIRSSRKDFPQLAKDKDMKRGDFDYRSIPGGITVYKWMGTKPVHFIYNYHGVSPSTVDRKTKDGTKVTVTCPSVVRDYNKHMGGVDKHDILRQLYSTDRKSKKWWHRLFFGLLDMTFINAYVVYREQADKSVYLYCFYREKKQYKYTDSSACWHRWHSRKEQAQFQQSVGKKATPHHPQFA